MCVDFIRHFLYLNSRHKFIASPRLASPHIKFSDGVPGGAVEPLCHARVPASTLMAAGSNVCAHFQEFLTMLSPPKMPG